MADHVLLLVLFAMFVSTVFAVLACDAPRDQLRLGGKIFGAFLLAGIVLGWLIYPFPL